MIAKSNTRIVITIPKKTLTKIDKEREHLSRSQLLTLALEIFLKEHGKGQNL